MEGILAVVMSPMVLVVTAVFTAWAIVVGHYPDNKWVMRCSVIAGPPLFAVFIVMGVYSSYCDAMDKVAQAKGLSGLADKTAELKAELKSLGEQVKTTSSTVTAVQDAANNLGAEVKNIGNMLNQQAVTLALIQTTTQNGYKSISKGLALRVQNDQMTAFETRSSLDRQTRAIEDFNARPQVVQGPPSPAYAYSPYTTVINRGRVGIVVQQ
jgi:hypothetical protein